MSLADMFVIWAERNDRSIPRARLVGFARGVCVAWIYTYKVIFTSLTALNIKMKQFAFPKKEFDMHIILDKLFYCLIKEFGIFVIGQTFYEDKSVLRSYMFITREI